MKNIDIKKAIKEMTLLEKANLLCGYRNWNTYDIERLRIPSLTVSDGPHGVRKEAGGNSLNAISSALKATCFPTGVTSSSSWNKEVLYSIGNDIAKECINFGIDVLLGPAINIKRNPRCGRNFEYYSEDPYLSGLLASSFVKGLQDNNVGACLKHFACNNQEEFRFNGDSVVDERALREIYLKPFEIAVKNSSPYSIMSSYNKINGTHASENKHIMKDILRDEWNYQGILMTDWGGLVDRNKSLLVSGDLEMPGQVKHNVNLIIEGVNKGLIPISTIDESIERILNIINKTKNEVVPCDFEKHYENAIRYAEESAVLLKNTDILPISKENKYLVIGDLFIHTRYQGAGSSLLNPYKIKSHKEVFDENGVDYDFALGYKVSELDKDEKLETAAIKKAEEADTIILFVGQTDYVECEGYDRDNMLLPENQLSLIDKLIKLNKKIVVVLFGGSSVELPFVNNVDAILNMLLPGVGGAPACYNLLFGNVNPSGKLSETWPISYNDVPFGKEFISSPIELYKESIYVGYRYYQKANKKVLFPFGYGLSYTTFEYKNLSVNDEEDKINISFNIKNVGKMKGKEVYQIYVSKNESTLNRPIRELKEFGKIELDINEEKEINVSLLKEELKVFDIKDNRFVLEDGIYDIEIGSSVDTILLKESISISGEKVNNSLDEEIFTIYEDMNKMLDIDNNSFEKLIGYQLPKYEKDKRPYTLETPISEFSTFWGKIVKKLIIDVGLSRYKKALKMKDSEEKETKKKSGLFLYKNMRNNTLRSLCFSSSGMLKYKYALVLLDLANNKIFKAIGKLFKKSQ